jgi:hypothetical protein
MGQEPEAQRDPPRRDITASLRMLTGDCTASGISRNYPQAGIWRVPGYSCPTDHALAVSVKGERRAMRGSALPCARFARIHIHMARRPCGNPSRPSRRPFQVTATGPAFWTQQPNHACLSAEHQARVDRLAGKPYVDHPKMDRRQLRVRQARRGGRNCAPEGGASA